MLHDYFEIKVKDVEISEKVHIRYAIGHKV